MILSTRFPVEFRRSHEFSCCVCITHIIIVIIVVVLSGPKCSGDGAARYVRAIPIAGTSTGVNVFA